MKCKLVKGKDGFSFNKIYDIKFAGNVYWVTNDYGDVICDADESFEIISNEDKLLNDTLHNLKNDIMDVLMKYVYQLNNKETRDNIYNDLTKLLSDKYANLMKDVDDVEEKL